MSQPSEILDALKWITGILDRHEVPYQAAGGLAARCYGSTRPLHDIDLYVPGRAMPELEEELKEYIEFGPSHHKDNEWDLVFMRLNYNGRQIELGDADRTRYFDSGSGRWVDEKIDFESSRILEFQGIKLPVIPKRRLIEYKQRLDRKVDRLDLKEIQD